MKYTDISSDDDEDDDDDDDDDEEEKEGDDEDDGLGERDKAQGRTIVPSRTRHRQNPLEPSHSTNKIGKIKTGESKSNKDNSATSLSRAAPPLPSGSGRVSGAAVSARVKSTCSSATDDLATIEVCILYARGYVRVCL